MRILAVTHSLETNGAAFALVRLLVALQGSGASVSVLHTQNHSLCEPLRAGGVSIVADAHTDDFDVAIVNTIIDYNWVAKLAPHLPVLFWVHEGLSLLSQLQNHNAWEAAFGLSSRIVFYTPWQSKKVFQSVLHRIEQHRIRYVPMGVPSRDNLPPIKSEATQRTVISIGSVYQRKRPLDLASAVLANTDIGMKCIFVGSLDWSLQNDPALISTIRQHPQSLFLAGESPATADMLDSSFVNQYMDSAGIYASGSIDETFGIANLEAAAWGLPPALSNLACYEGIWRHGVNALMHPVGQVDCLAWNLRALALDPALSQRIAHAATLTARRYSMERFVKTMARTLEECITDRVMPS